MIDDYPNNPISEIEMFDKYKNNKYFGGISADFNLKSVEKDKFYIILMRDRRSNSGHWTVLLCDFKKCCHFDSFGLPPDKNIIKRCVEVYDKKNIFYSDFMYQNLQSNRCGVYVDFVISFWLKGFSYPKIIKKLNKVSENREKK